MCVVSTTLTRLYTRCGGAQTSTAQSRSQNDKNERIVQEGFETPEMNCAQEPMRTLMMMTVVVYAVGSYSFGGATMAQGGSAEAAKNVVLVHGAFGEGSRWSEI